MYDLLCSTHAAAGRDYFCHVARVTPCDLLYIISSDATVGHKHQVAPLKPPPCVWTVSFNEWTVAACSFIQTSQKSLSIIVCSFQISCFEGIYIKFEWLMCAIEISSYNAFFLKFLNIYFLNISNYSKTLLFSLIMNISVSVVVTFKI